MSKVVKPIAILLFAAHSAFAIAGETKVLKRLPESYSLAYGKVVYVENDGRCKAGEVIKVTGGKKSAGIPRKYECVRRPR
jgi:Family of unknown function (DUF6719)